MKKGMRRVLVTRRTRPKPKPKPKKTGPPVPRDKHEAARKMRTGYDTMDHGHAQQFIVPIVQALQAADIEFFLIQGTALGAYRDGGFAPKDRDIDFGMLYENFAKDVHKICRIMVDQHFEIRTVNRPFTRPRVLNAVRKSVKIDFVSYIPWKDKRFCTSTYLPYSVVHEGAILEPPYKLVEWFGETVQVPRDIEEYLKLEYDDWKTPREDSLSRTRVDNFRKDNEIDDKFLASLTGHSAE